jgi:hypothetical protein
MEFVLSSIPLIYIDEHGGEGGGGEEKGERGKKQFCFSGFRKSRKLIEKGVFFPLFTKNPQFCKNPNLLMYLD